MGGCLSENCGFENCQKLTQFVQCLTQPFMQSIQCTYFRLNNNWVIFSCQPPATWSHPLGMHSNTIRASSLLTLSTELNRVSWQFKKLLIVSDLAVVVRNACSMYIYKSVKYEFFLFFTSYNTSMQRLAVAHTSLIPRLLGTRLAHTTSQSCCH